MHFKPSHEGFILWYDGDMLTFIGLGNPGEEYERTRHNIGRMILIALAKTHHFPDFAIDTKAKALISIGKIEKTKVRLVLPETFMNKSGDSVRALALKSVDAVLVHDDSDILFEGTKLSFGKRSAGHRGVESVTKALKTIEYLRLRIGIQKKKRVPAEELVLKKYTPKEMLAVKKIVKHAVGALTCVATDSPERAMSEYNR